MDEEKAERAQTAEETRAGREPAARRMIAYLLIGVAWACREWNANPARVRNYRC
jgi:endo-alpha-1,4-polygalactosaminidase (GH114 family)